MILLKREQNSETIIAFMKENIILCFWIAFYSWIILRAKATIKKSKQSKKTIRREYKSLFFHIMCLFAPILANIMSEGNGAREISF